MKYIIMCGGEYTDWATPRQMSVIRGEEIVARTIRLLRENGIEDISISTHDKRFAKYGVPLLEHDNYYKYENGQTYGSWYNAFYPTDEPTCYIFGDVYFSDEAIRTIVETETDDIEFFGSSEVKEYASNYFKSHVEPFALKVVDTNHLKRAVAKTRELDAQGAFWRTPIMWELWTVIKDLPLQTVPDIYPYDSYVAINDYTCDVDSKWDLKRINEVIK